MENPTQSTQNNTGGVTLGNPPLVQIDDRTKLAFEAARDTSKQFINLASGITALTITFSKDFLNNATGPQTRILALVAWGIYLFSIFFGLLALMVLTGSVTRYNASIYDNKIRIFVGIQIVMFFLALVFTVAFGISGII